MLLKRSIVLAAGVLLFIVAFIIYFDVSHAQMEDRFRAEREKFGVQGAVLTASQPATPTEEAAPSAAPAPAPSPNAVPDTTPLIGPVPPPSSSPPDSTTTPASPATPDTNSAPATPAAPDTNSAPATPPSSTMNDRRENHSPFFQLASYRPFDGASVQYQMENPPVPGQPPARSVWVQGPTTTNVEVYPSTATNAVPAATAPSPATNAIPAATASSRATNAAPAASSRVESGVAHPSFMEGSVIVLLYHQFRPAGVPIPAKFQWTLHQDVFEAEMKYIHDNGYHVVPLSDVLRFLKHEITLPPGSVCITIDDGYKSAIVYAAPILKKYGYPWTFFIYPEYITVGEGNANGAASWNDLLELQKEGVDIESHSMTHPQLTRHKQLIKNVWHNFTPEEYDAWLTNETAGAKALLEQKMGKPITSFAYPFGDYNKQVEAAAIAAGYETILTVAGNPVHSTTDPHSIGRYTITQEEVKNFEADLRQGALGLGDAEPAAGATISNPRPVISAVLGYAGALDPKSIQTSVYDFDVRHDFDPQTNTVRLYLPRDLIQSVVPVNIRVKDAATGQLMVAKWRFNYEPVAAAATGAHPPIAPATNSPSASTKAPAPASTTTASTTTNASRQGGTADPPSLQKSPVAAPLDAHQAPEVSPTPAPRALPD